MNLEFIQKRIVELSQDDMVNYLFDNERTHFVEKFLHLFEIAKNPDLQEEYEALNKELCVLIGIDENGEPCFGEPEKM